MFKNVQRFLRLLTFLFVFLPAIALASPQQVDFLLNGFKDSAGEPLSGGKVYTYVAGTTTNKTTWSDYGETTPHANPIILDANGAKQVFADGLYKFVIKDSADNTLYTYDNLLFRQYNGSDTWAGTTGGVANTYTSTLSPPLLSLIDGAEITFRASATNTGASTLNVNSLGATSIYRKAGVALTGGELISGYVYTARYSSSATAWLLTDQDPAFTTWSPTLTGFSANPTSGVYRYSVHGQEVCIYIYQPNYGTSNLTTYTMTLPFTAATITGQNWVAAFQTGDSSALQASPGLAIIASAGTVVTFYKTMAAGAFTNSGGKLVSGQMCYER